MTSRAKVRGVFSAVVFLVLSILLVNPTGTSASFNTTITTPAPTTAVLRGYDVHANLLTAANTSESTGRLTAPLQAPVPRVGRLLPSSAVAAEAGDGAIAFGPAPEDAWNTLTRIEEKGSPFPGYKGGSGFANDGSQGSQILPGETSGGDPITYREWDVNPNVEGVDRGGERIVTGSDGSAYYTNDQYKWFTQFSGSGG
jgi:guanyl-specific ribonuclease Sa